MHVAECTDFQIKINGESPYTSDCIKENHVTSRDNGDLNDTYAEYEDENIAHKLSSAGYK